MNRRDFVKSALAVPIVGMADGAVGGTPLPPWKQGELELHFIYTGCGENMFYRLPDGTAILNDVGDAYRPKDVAYTPLLPSSERLGGEWVSRYIGRVYPEKSIDYLIFSHWHADHVGHAGFGQKSTPEMDWRYRTTADGRKIDGFLCVAEDFSFKRYFDHQYPARGTYGSHGMCMHLVAPWVEEQKRKGLAVEPFKVGALDQIALLRDPGKYKGVFSIRNICANGRLWDGRDGERDFAAETVTATGKDYLPQNMLSMGFVIQYGKFRFWTGGDVQPSFMKQGFATKDGPINYEAEVGRRVGPVTVCKTNHHSCIDAMSADFIRSVRAQAYITCVWSHWHVVKDTMERMASRDLHPDFDPLIIPNFMPTDRAREFCDMPFMRNVPPETKEGVHVVVKVAPGGERYRIYLVDARDESMRVRACLEPRV
ncbi:MAG: hypothetical protein IKO72_15390 [Kiritimatiellae bacterium]|nr:hypothetical protein [Kiritimatiellia bacterium]